MLITSLSAGIVLILAGILIWRFKLVMIMVRSRPGRVTDREGLAKWVGLNMMIMGLAVCVLAAVQVVIFGNTRLIVDIVTILLLSTRMAVGAAKFSQPPAKAAKKPGSGKKRRTKEIK
jgi:nitrate/nitrite transporter NarK